MKLPKSGRLHHRSLQENLFAKGNNIHEFPLRMIWYPLSNDELKANFRDKVPDLIGPLQVLVSVPKKKRRRAVDRVRMRRLMREAYRLGRAPLLEKVTAIEQIRTLSIGLIYRKEENADWAEIKAKTDKLIEKLIEKLDKKYHGDSVETSD